MLYDAKNKTNTQGRRNAFMKTFNVSNMMMCMRGMMMRSAPIRVLQPPVKQAD